MAAIKLVNTLRAKNRDDDSSVSGAGTMASDVEWGTMKVLGQVDLHTLTRHELRNHLEARDLSGTGNKRELFKRLEKSVLEDQVKAHADAEVAEFELNADLEERGSVYGVGTGSSGQLGMGDIEHRPYFTVVPLTRGAGVCRVSCGYDIACAITEDHDVLMWGGKGVGPCGVTIDLEDSDDMQQYLEPKPIRELIGEEIIKIGIGAGHAVAVSQGGDCYVWGRGDSGQLGLGNFNSYDLPGMLNSLQDGDACFEVGCGENSSFVVTTRGGVYAWGHGENGRLGIGTSERVNVEEKERHFFPTPMLLNRFAREFVRDISCGPNYTLALTNTGLWSWGCGAGGVLGHGDFKDRDMPDIVDGFHGMYVMSIAASTYHSAAIVMVPPLVGGGYVYTWGSGYHGQLAQNDIQVSTKPALVQGFLKTQQIAASIHCGPFHNAVVTAEGELYTWGSNKHGCLGRSVPGDKPFTPDPGHVGGFGALVDGVGRGLPRSVSCGKEFTLVATYPYEGPVLEEADRLDEEMRLEAETIALHAAEEERLLGLRKSYASELKDEQNKAADELANKVKLCSICDECPGFKSDAVRENLCGICRHAFEFHTRGNAALTAANFTASHALSKT